jgi:hypothetical protein
MQQQDHSETIEISENTETLSEEASTNNSTCTETLSQATTTVDSVDFVETPTGASSPFTDVQASGQLRRWRFDWPALSTALAVAAFFALTARFNNQPAPSYIPAAIFSATGCGLLVTAVRKLRSLPGVGLLEAGLSGFGMALLQFGVALTYPSVWSTITGVPDYGRPFLITWGLIALFAVILSLAGATLGHLTFTPLRPLPARRQKHSDVEEDEEELAAEADEENEEQQASEATAKTEEQAIEAGEEVEEEQDSDQAEEDGDEQVSEVEEEQDSDQAEEDGDEQVSEVEEGRDDEVEDEQDSDQAEEDGDEQVSEVEEGRDDEVEEQVTESEEENEDRDTLVATANVQPRRALTNYAIAVLLLSLLPMMAGYVFAATYDFILNAINVSAISPALYPTLSLLSGLLPWRLAAPITLSGTNGAFIVFTLLWRIPDSVLGNPNLFDVQALEALVFNAAALALLLITMYGSDNHGSKRQPAPWGVFLFLEALCGLILVLPSGLWLLRGLEGVLQISTLVAQLPTIQLLNPALFILNLVTGALFCLIIGLIMRRQYQLWTLPRVKNTQIEEELD